MKTPENQKQPAQAGQETKPADGNQKDGKQAKTTPAKQPDPSPTNPVKPQASPQQQKRPS